MARTRLALESGLANETSRLRRGNKQKGATAVLSVEKTLLLRFVRPQVNKILHAHHYCANYRRRNNAHRAWVRCTENFTRIYRQTHEPSVMQPYSYNFRTHRNRVVSYCGTIYICTSLRNDKDAHRGVN